VTRRDQASRTERDRIRAEPAEPRTPAERPHQARPQAAAERKERYQRWGLRWTREPEHVHQDQHAPRPPTAPPEARSAEAMDQEHLAA
jgi:hypothetical protein